MPIGTCIGLALPKVPTCRKTCSDLGSLKKRACWLTFPSCLDCDMHDLLSFASDAFVGRRATLKTQRVDDILKSHAVSRRNECAARFAVACRVHHSDIVFALTEKPVCNFFVRINHEVAQRLLRLTVLKYRTDTSTPTLAACWTWPVSLPYSLERFVSGRKLRGHIHAQSVAGCSGLRACS